MKEHLKTTERYNKLKDISNEDKQITHQKMNNFVTKYYNKCYKMVQTRLYKFFKDSITQYIIKECLQNMFVFMYTCTDNLLKIQTEEELCKWFNSICNSPITIGYAWDYVKYTELPEDFDIEEEVEEPKPFECSSLENLARHTDNRTRLHYHYIAIEELYEYLVYNRNSILYRALRECWETDPMLYSVACHYSATPSMKFLHRNRDTLRLTNIQGNVTEFKNIIAKLTGRTPKQTVVFKW